MQIRSNSELIGAYAVDPLCFTQSQATHSIDNYIKDRCSQLLQCEKEELQTMEGKKAEDLAAIKKTMGKNLIAANISNLVWLAAGIALIALTIFLMLTSFTYAASVVLVIHISNGAFFIPFCITGICLKKYVDTFKEHIRDFLADYIQNRNVNEQASLLN